MKLVHNMTDYFPVQFGVKQGCKLSPSIFSIYINDLAEEMRALNDGVEIGDAQLLSILLYADDIALVAPDEQSLQTCWMLLTDGVKNGR